MARTRARPRPRTVVGSRRRRQRSVRRRVAISQTKIWPLAAKITVVALVVGLAVAVPWVVLLLTDIFRRIIEGLVNVLGVGLLPGAALSAAIVWIAAGRPRPSSSQSWRRLAGVGALLVAANGLLSLYRPDWRVGDVLLREVTAGGRFGSLFTNTPLGLLVLTLAIVAGLSLAWPQGLALGGRGGQWLWSRVAALRLPQRGWAMTKAVLSSFLPMREAPTASEAVPGVIPGDEPAYFAAEEEHPEAVVEGTAVVKEFEAGDKTPRFPPGDTPSSAQESPGQAKERMPSLTFPSGLGWELPALDLLRANGENGSRTYDDSARAQLIVDTLGSFGVDARVVQINRGPTVTQFGVEPGWEVKTRTVIDRDAQGRPAYDKDGNPKYRTEVVSRTRVRVSQITGLANDLALALAAPSIRIEAPVPGKPIVGIEVPNHTPSLVTLRSTIESPGFQRLAGRSKLTLALGKGVSGEPVAADLARMPHLLIAGATGSGKSVCINAIISCLLMHATPDVVRFVLIDPKRVELSAFARIPHLAFSSIVTNLEDVVGALQAVLHEMEERYRRFAATGVRNIDGYNRNPKGGRKLPYWVVIIDELADLMMSAPYQIEKQICRLAQLARATGIHLVVATQRPSVDVVTGLIKANFPTRIAFAVTSQVDSRTIIDSGGAEKLLGRGDMLYMPTDAAKPKRLQGVYVSDQEIERVVAYWTSAQFGHLQPETADHLLVEAKTEAEENDDDRLLRQARELALQHSRISTSLLQRRLRIGYPRAARLIDHLEKEGIVGPAESGQSRRVLLRDAGLDEAEGRFGGRT